MGKRWWEEKEYQLQDGRWVPQVHLMELIPDGVEVHRLLAREGFSLGTQAEAKAYSAAMALKWLEDKGLI